MLLSYHLPITDLRPLLPKPSGKLARPEWPLPLQDNEFVRGFGQVQTRIVKRDDYFGGGSEVCDARGVIRFTSTDPQITLPDGKTFKIDCKFRRFFVFSGPNAKIELGLTQKVTKPPIDPIAIEAILEGLCNLPVVISLPQAPFPSKAPKTPLNHRKPRERVESALKDTLGYFGKNIAQALLHASTSSRDGVNLESWWVQVGEPIIFLEFNAEEPFEVPALAQLLDSSDSDIDIYKYILKNKHTVSYIIKRKNHNKARAKSRTLRIILGDLHCRISNVMIILANLRKDRIRVFENTEPAKRIQIYFKKQMKLLNGLIKKDTGYKMTGSQVEIPIPFDAARINALNEKIEEWKAEEPGFFRDIAILLNSEVEISGAEVKIGPLTLKLNPKSSSHEVQ